MADSALPFLVCVRVADFPRATVPSYRDRCGACGFEVWRSNRSAYVDVAGCLCVPCAALGVATNPDIEVTTAAYVAADLAERHRLP